MTMIAGCIGINSKNKNVEICGRLLRDLRKNPNWFVCQRGNEYGAIGSVGAIHETAHFEEWVLVLHGGPVWEKSGYVLNSRDILQRCVIDGIEKTIGSLVGQFAFAIYNIAERKLWMYSDKSGTNLIYYVCKGDKVAFSVLPISLNDAFGGQLKVKKSSLIGFMLGLPEELVGCLFVDQEVVPKGCLIEWDLISGSQKKQPLQNAEFDDLDIFGKAISGLKDRFAFFKNDIAGNMVANNSAWDNILSTYPLCANLSQNISYKNRFMSYSLYVEQVASVCQRPVRSVQSYWSYNAIFYAKRNNIKYLFDFAGAPFVSSDNYFGWKKILIELVDGNYFPAIKDEKYIERDLSNGSNFALDFEVSVVNCQVVTGDTFEWQISADTLEALGLSVGSAFDEVKSQGQKIMYGEGVSSFLYRSGPFKDWFEESFGVGNVTSVNNYILLLRFVCLDLWLKSVFNRRNVKLIDNYLK